MSLDIISKFQLIRFIDLFEKATRERLTREMSQTFQSRMALMAISENCLKQHEVWMPWCWSGIVSIRKLMCNANECQVQLKYYPTEENLIWCWLELLQKPMTLGSSWLIKPLQMTYAAHGVDFKTAPDWRKWYHLRLAWNELSSSLFFWIYRYSKNEMSSDKEEMLYSASEHFTIDFFFFCQWIHWCTLWRLKCDHIPVIKSSDWLHSIVFVCLLLESAIQ